jgi:ABC-type microcin C transport system duplicated ATPase subunit YejF
MIISSLNDPVAQILAKNSHLTKTQLETLLIDILSENASGKSLKYDEKARLRLTKAKISRGSFNRTLKQAKQNVIKAIYTILLLGYLGIFENSTLNPYLEIGNKLHEYIEAYKSISNKTEQLKIMEMLRDELETRLKQLAKASPEEL